MFTTQDRLSDQLLRRRIIVLADEVDDESATRVVSQLLVLSHADPDADIYLYVNSPGGSVIAGLAIYDVMQLVPNDVVTVAVGLAASMGQIILCAGTAGRRFALPHAQVLMHEGSAGLGGAAADVEIQAANLLATLDRMRQIISTHTGQPLERVAADVGRDRWFDAEEAREYGFVDHVVDSFDQLGPPVEMHPVGIIAPTGSDRIELAAEVTS